jgi:hypothetical protein
MHSAAAGGQRGREEQPSQERAPTCERYETHRQPAGPRDQGLKLAKVRRSAQDPSSPTYSCWLDAAPSSVGQLLCCSWAAATRVGRRPVMLRVRAQLQAGRLGRPAARLRAALCIMHQAGGGVRWGASDCRLEPAGAGPAAPPQNGASWPHRPSCSGHPPPALHHSHRLLAAACAGGAGEAGQQDESGGCGQALGASAGGPASAALVDGEPRCACMRCAGLRGLASGRQSVPKTPPAAAGQVQGGLQAARGTARQQQAHLKYHTARQSPYSSTARVALGAVVAAQQN